MSEKDKIITFRRPDNEYRIDIIEIVLIEEAAEMLAFWVNEEDEIRLFLNFLFSSENKFINVTKVDMDVI